MSEQRHTLTILDGGTGFFGELLFSDNTVSRAYRVQRTQIIAWAQREIEKYNAQPAGRSPAETLILDGDGLIVREPDQHSIRVEA